MKKHYSGLTVTLETKAQLRACAAVASEHDLKWQSGNSFENSTFSDLLKHLPKAKFVLLYIDRQGFSYALLPWDGRQQREKTYNAYRCKSVKEFCRELALMASPYGIYG